MSEVDDKEIIPIRGDSVIATYRSPKLPQFKGNPLVEALPPEWNWDEDIPGIMLALQCCPPVDRDGLPTLTACDREDLLTFFKLGFFCVFSRHRDLERAISRLLRFGYLTRNPLEPRFRRSLYDRLQAVKAEVNRSRVPYIPGSHFSMTLLGSPGLGKTHSIGRILQLYPQIIKHDKPEFNHAQVLWMYLTCVHDRSTRGLCLLFLRELDAIVGTNKYDEYKDATEDVLMSAMAAAAGSHYLGLLVIDEIQFLSAGKSGGKTDLMSFFVQLQNTLGIPIMLVGTHRAKDLVAGTPHQARRSVGIGGKVWDLFTPEDPEWDAFLETLWEQQYTANYVSIDADWKSLVYDLTQGNPNYSVDLFYFTQLRAIQSKSETISPELMKLAAREDMAFNRPYIDALRVRNTDPIAARVLEDVLAADYEHYRPFFAEKLRLPKTNSWNPIKTPHSGDDVSECRREEGRVPSLQPPAVRLNLRSKTASSKKPRKAKREHFNPGSLMDICEQGYRLDGLAPYPALQRAGIICQATEFLPSPTKPSR